MNEKLSVRKLSTELEIMRNRIKDLEQKLETSLAQTVSRLRRASSDGKGGIGQEMDKLVMSVISNEYRRELITKTAYFNAEKRGFVGGDSEQDWLDAEAEVDRYLMERHAPAPEIKTGGDKVSASAAPETRTAEKRIPGTLSLTRP